MNRIHVLDILRGFAIVSIMLLHSIEHFDVYYFPEQLPEWMKSFDKVIWTVMFFLFSGKSYSIFALLFGVTFAIQLNNQKKRNQKFDGRFAWRMLLLFVFGIFNAAFFQGDVLGIYATLGILLIPLSKLKDSVVLGLAIFLMLLPSELVKLFYALQHPAEAINDPVSWSYFGKMFEYIGEPSFWGTVYGNLTNGRHGVLLWNWENGRYFSILALFLFGYLMGKRNLFVWNESTKVFWSKAFKISIIAFIPLYIVQLNLENIIESDIIRRSVATIETAWTNLAFMTFLVSGIVVLFNKFNMKSLMYFSHFGKMSLSNYIIQSILGGFIYYGYGLGLWNVTGATYGLLIGFALTLLMGKFCKWWANNHKHGPFETLWHKATWIGTSK